MDREQIEELQEEQEKAIATLTEAVWRFRRYIDRDIDLAGFVDDEGAAILLAYTQAQKLLLDLMEKIQDRESED